MSRHSGPHFTLPPDGQRCEALVKGHPSYHWEWMRTDHRCPRKACQTRGLSFDVRVISVCYQHAKSKAIEEWKDDNLSAVS